MNIDSALAHLRAEDAHWAMSPLHLQAMAERLAREAAGPARRSAWPPVALTTAVVPIIGPLTRRASFISEMLGLSTYDNVRAALAKAISDKTVSRIVLYIDSPGGGVSGCAEAAEAVAKAARVKPVVAFCDGLMASAAFWIGSQANDIACTPSGECGSVGVVAVHMQYAEALTKAGVQPTILISRISPRKADANPYQPLDPDAKTRALAEIDEIAAGFVSSVARGRRVTTRHVTEHFGKGGTLFASAAKSVGMIDRVASFENLIAELRQPGASKTLAHVFTRQRDAQHRRRRLAILGAS